MNENNPECIATKIRLLTHAIEKGMSLPNCRKGFGKQKIIELINLCAQYETLPSCEDPQAIELAYGLIRAYVEFHSEDDIELSFISQEVYRRANNSKVSSGIRILSGLIDPSLFQSVSKHRHSLRYFSSLPVSEDDIRKAVALAQTAPSACNRQPIHVYAITSQEKIHQIMQLHGGIRSFSNPAVIFIITGDRSLYQSEYERNTVYVDGGIFTMNFLYALDSVGIASCPAIWGNIPNDDNQLIKIAKIPHSHTIINLVVAGYYPEHSYKVASSVKRETDNILCFVR